MADITKNATEMTKESLARIADNPSAQTLRAIEIVEEHLREKRSRIEEIQMQRDHLVHEIEQLNKTLESENVDLVPWLKAVINNLDTDGAIMELHPDKPVKRGSLRWLKEKERPRRETSKSLSPDPEGSS